MARSDVWICTSCGAQVRPKQPSIFSKILWCLLGKIGIHPKREKESLFPEPQATGTCPATCTGNHIWRIP